MGILFGKKKPGYHSGITNEGGARAGPRSAGGDRGQERPKPTTQASTSNLYAVDDAPPQRQTQPQHGSGGGPGSAETKPRSNSVVEDSTMPGEAPGGHTSHFEVKVTPQNATVNSSTPAEAAVHADFVPVVIQDKNRQLSAPSSTPGASAPVKAKKEKLMPLQRVVNLYAISLRLFSMCRTVMVAKSWNDTLFLQMMQTAATEFDREMRIVKVHERLKDWVAPLHFRKTGSVLGAGRRLAQAWQEFSALHEALQQAHGEGYGPNEQRAVKDSLKELIQLFVQLLSCTEMVVPADFTLELNELARTIRDVVDTASGKLNFVYDDVARICTTTSVRLSRLSLWKGLQVKNTAWTRAVNDTCFTVTKATKVLHVVGLKLHEAQQDQVAFQNLTALTKGIVVQIRKVQEMTQADPPAIHTQLTFTAELVQEHMRAYEQGIREVQQAMERYAANQGMDATVQAAVTNILSQLQSIKMTVQTPDNATLAVAVASISDSVERFCGAVYFALHQLGEQYEVIKEQVMETMQTSLHCLLLLQLVSSSRSLFYTVVNPEITMLVALRTLLLSVSIVIDAMEYLTVLNAVDVAGDDATTENLRGEDINEAVIYILHYGRPLFKGDDGSNRPEESSSEEELPAPVTAVTPQPVASQPAPKKPQTEVVNPFGREAPSTNLNINAFLPDKPAKAPQPTAASNPNASFNSPSISNNTSAYSPSTSTNSTPKSSSSPNVSRNVQSDSETTLQLATGIINEPVSPAASSSPAPAPSVSIPAGANLTAEEEGLLKLGPVDSYNENNLPPGFEKGPPKPHFEKGGTEEQYKAYMIQKYEYETWENKLVLWKIKTKKRIAEVKQKAGI